MSQYLASISRGVAQPGSAPALGAGGRWFESSRPDQISDLYVTYRSQAADVRIARIHAVRPSTTPTTCIESPYTLAAGIFTPVEPRTPATHSPRASTTRRKVRSKRLRVVTQGRLLEGTFSPHGGVPTPTSLTAYRPTRHKDAVTKVGAGAITASFTSSPRATMTKAVSTGDGAPGKKMIEVPEQLALTSYVPYAGTSF